MKCPKCGANMRKIVSFPNRVTTRTVINYGCNKCGFTKSEWAK